MSIPVNDKMMSEVSKCFVNEVVVKPIVKGVMKPINAFCTMWGPTRIQGGASNSVGAAATTVGYLICAAGKLVGRTVSLFVGFGAAAFALHAIAGTALGASLGVTAFVATVSAFPPALFFTGVAVGLVATGILASFLIENYAK